MSETVRVGIVGCGGMGRTHAHNAREHGHHVVAGADVVEDVRNAFTDQFDAAGYANHERMYDAEDPDAVIITTPNKFHEPAAVDALERDIAVLCEKPLAHNLDSAARIVEAAEASDAFFMVGFHNRFTTPADVFTTRRDAGEFGDVDHVEANYLRRRGIPGLGSWFTNRELSGGGALIDLGVHAIDLALYLADYPEVVEVSGVTRAEFGTRDEYADPDGWAGNWDTSEGGFDVDDSVSAFIRCADDTTISLEVSWAANREPTHEFHVWGTDAGAQFELGEEDLTLLSCTTEGTDQYVDTTLDGEIEPSGHAAEDELFLDAVAAGEDPEINTPEQGLQVQRVIDAIYRSSEEGGAVRLD
ncbi:oxidoreductase [Halarchaeum grantii]|uniref:Oxidoreductase n=1 Tax=Halarchaeum grantii TaxID=1193105 RepID=A0A830F4G6_9EURY|nr:Gfo/Idh/MocA family oxidoreductase [Halarchaeum grantii]GGL37827.1 oxidoreductase [Halarchaeum grantii]